MSLVYSFIFHIVAIARLLRYSVKQSR